MILFQKWLVFKSMFLKKALQLILKNQIYNCPNMY